MTCAAFVTVCVKLFTRVKIVQVVGLDDFFIVLSMVLSIIASAFVHYGVSLGFGRRTVAVAAEYGVERLFKTARYQILGYRTLSLYRDLARWPPNSLIQLSTSAPSASRTSPSQSSYANSCTRILGATFAYT